MKFAMLMMAVQAMGQSVFRSDTLVVEVAVVATRGDGSIVKDLRRDEIRVFDNNKAQTIASFELIGGATPEGGRAARRLMIIVIDSLNSSWCSQSYGRDAVAEVLAKMPQGAERIAIFALGEELRLLHDFSNDRDSLREAVEDYEGEQPFIGVDQNPDHPEIPLLCPHVTPVNPGPMGEVNQDWRVRRSLEAFTKIARRMKDFQGEKSLLWVTEAFPPPPAHQEMERAVEELATAKVRLYPVDARGLMGAFDTAGIGTMEELAEPTGGRAFYGGNDTTALVQAALDNSHEGYVLTFSPKDYREDGSVHYLSLKTSRKGVELRYREGYVATSSGR